MFNNEKPEGKRKVSDGRGGHDDDGDGNAENRSTREAVSSNRRAVAQAERFAEN